MSAGDFQIVATAAGAHCVHIRGDWTLAHYLAIDHCVDTADCDAVRAASIDFTELGELDTAGAGLLAELLGNVRLCSTAASDTTLSPERRALLSLVGGALQASIRQPRHRPPSGALAMVERTGVAMDRVWHEATALLGFIGLTLETLARLALHPGRWRITSLLHHMEESGLDAVPIVTLLSFMVGAVIAFLGATVLATYGATLFTVDLVGYAFLREFGVLLAAILLAGRTASAFTAQIGSMQAREEIDAIRTLGLDPIELLVVPRTLALVFTLPMLAFLGTIAGIAGGAVVCIVALDITPAMFLTELQANSGLRHLLVGLVKAPIFAFMIAMIGCLEGFQASSSAESVGRQTTSSVVQSIFVVILFDALAALFFMEMEW